MALEDDWVHYWKCEEPNGDLIDVIGGADGSTTDMTYQSTGFIDYGVSSAANGYVNIGDNCSLGSAATWTFALKTTDAGTITTNRFIFKNSASPNRSYFIYLDAGKIGVYGSNNGTTEVFGTSGTEFSMLAINDDTYRRFAIVYDGTARTIKLFQDGSLIDTLTSVDGVPTSFNTNNVNCTIMSQGGGNPLTGSIDEIGFANVAKSDADMITLTGSNTLQYPFSSSLELTSPNGGETLIVGRGEEITWTDSGAVVNVKLEFSDDNGVSWSDIVASTANDGSYDWIVSDSVTVQGLVRVSDVLDSDNNDASDAVFDVIPPPNTVVGGGKRVNSWLSLIPFKALRYQLIEFSNGLLRDWGFLSPHIQIADDFSAVVVKVHDGDTIRVKTDFRSFSFPVRLANIDAPELNEGGADARNWLRSRILGKRVVIRVNPKNRVGKYGRLIGEVYHRGFNVGDEMRTRGLVYEFGQRNLFDIPPTEKLLSKYRVSLT